MFLEKHLTLGRSKVFNLHQYGTWEFYFCVFMDLNIKQGTKTDQFHHKTLEAQDDDKDTLEWQPHTLHRHKHTHYTKDGQKDRNKQ